MTPRIVPLSGSVETELSVPAADRLIAGDPRQGVSNYFSDTTQQFFAGFSGTWEVLEDCTKIYAIFESRT